MDAIVRTRQGVVQGNMGQGVAAFKGIPYAAAPFGRHRFQPPQPAEPWEGVRQALTYGPTVPKAPLVAPFDALIPETDLPGQECLNLNIWSRDLQQGRLPVMVWIHGGAFSNGSGSNPFLMARASPAMASSVSPSTIGWEPRASSSWGTVLPISACLTR